MGTNCTCRTKKLIERKIVAFIVNELKQMPDAEKKLKEFLQGYRLRDSDYIHNLSSYYGVKGVGQFIIEELSKLHEVWTGMPLSEAVKGKSLPEKWQ